MVTALQIIGGLVLLFIGGEILVRGAVALAKDLGLSAFIIGLTVVAYGTSSPELVISVQSALDNHPDIALGNVIGSNISNILCVIGLTALICPIAIDKKESGFDGKIMLGVTALLTALCFLGMLNIISAVIFLGTLVGYTYFIFHNEKKKKRQQKLSEDTTAEIEEQLKVSLSRWQAIAFCIGGIILLMLGGDTLITGAVTLAKMAGLSEAVIGVTLIAMGGSAPELITSVVAAFHKKSDIALGNIIGSNLFNILGILGITTALSPIEVAPKFLEQDLPILALTTVALLAVMLMRPVISRFAGCLFFAGYIGYLGLQFYS
ncbi:MAG: calcium/sodium antiporter [Rickettsiales bacterium]|nr:calcium/sodium antiporter [Pseudomonadota bacterium]MDA0966017.1 calcium/sodium antiporter [Pseudomonadota bacterium]MDG4542512.1 calcium/sodium antiporter [Rickettsiales bacterium]MDG4545016.1 calcium/sodium antiporter [Rickettsiales bacterium]MDG4547139.1 calcium/sodium antiporter [Rickettsiales bacterium]